MREYRKIGNQDYRIEMNYHCRVIEKRGYYLSIKPIEIKDGMEIYTTMLGEQKPDELFVFLLQVARKSKKKETEALEIAKKLIEEHFAMLEAKNKEVVNEY